MLKFVKFKDPPEALKPYVWFTVIVEDSKTNDSSFNYDIVPLGDTCIVFPIFNWAGEEGGRAGMSFLLVAGPMSKVMRLMITPKQVVCVRLRAGAFHAMFGVPAHKIKDRTIFFEKFWGSGGKVLQEKMRQAPDTEARIQVLEEELLRRVDDFKQPDPYAVKAAELMKACNGKMTVEVLAARLGYTERQLHRKFEDGVGLTPKEYQRVLRCRLLILRMLNGDFKDWSNLVNDYGYFDQAHLIHEFKSFMGISPEKFLKKFKTEGKILESPLQGVQDETAMLGYEEDPSGNPRPPFEFTPIDLETVTRQSAAFSPPDEKISAVVPDEKEAHLGKTDS